MSESVRALVERLRAGENFYAESSLWFDRKLAEAVEEAADEIELLCAQVDALQARVDALMLEFCPDEMTDAQKENWARHQRPALGANLRLGGPVNETPEQTLARLQVAEEIARADAVKNHRMPCVPWRGRGGALGACIYCGKMPDAKGDHDGR